MDRNAELAAGFLEALGKPLSRDVSLKELSSFRIGGPADLFFEAATSDELAAAVGFARRTGIPHYVIGGGYNMLFADEGYRGLVVRNRAQGLTPEPEPGEVEALSGTPLSLLLQHALDSDLEGLEFLAGIPGTVGGALCGNAGAFGRAMGDVFIRAVFLGDDGNERAATREDMAFGYRHSVLKTRPAVALRAVLRAVPGDPERIRKAVRENLECRRERQPAWETPCAGSFFKNPVLADGKKLSAGGLLEEVGAKKLRVGDAAVFSGHANFLINLGGARAADVLALAAELKKRVKENSGIVLEEEVIFLPGSVSMS
ncbi:MAG TPA: UDP-N-acetylmuramate dehydrogenase [Acidobacteriota bacterium]|nr:UDP-N-acetylmuramate dehydrogenase [Acidobacteriota bacterium]